LNINLHLRQTRKKIFLDQMDKVVPWSQLVQAIATYYPEGKKRSTTFLTGNHAAHAFLAAMVQFI
jgi:hypothetical protein